MPSRCLNHCIVFPLNYEKGSRRLSTRISFGLWLTVYEGREAFLPLMSDQVHKVNASN